MSGDRIDQIAEIWKIKPITIQKTSFLLFLLLASVSHLGGQQGESIGRRSEVRQIKVFCKEPFVRSQFDVYSRDLRRQFRNMLGFFRDDDWNVRYEIKLYGNGNDVHSGIDIYSKSDIFLDQFRITIRAVLHDRFEEDAFRLELIKAFLFEQMLEAYADESEALKEGKIIPPDWMVHGFDHNIKHRALGRPSYFYSGFLKSGNLMSVREIMKPSRADGLNPVSLELFKASSAILVGALCDQKGGGESFRGMLKDLAVRPNANPESLIRKHFPGFRETKQGIDKWWALQLATMSQQQAFEYYTPADTEKHLREALAVYFQGTKAPDKPTEEVKLSFFDRIKSKTSKRKPPTEDVPEFHGSIERYKEFIAKKGAKSVIRNRQRALAALKVKAFPLYREVIDRYMSVCESLLIGDSEVADKELAELAKYRASILKTIEETRDYLNYYEATRTPKRSKAFDSYIKFREASESMDLPKRHDGISRFMDSIEYQHTKQSHP